MTSLWNRLRKKTETRDELGSIDDYQFKYLKHGGNFYPLGMGTTYAKQEKIDNDFQSYIAGAYKASGVVFACCMARMSIFSEARFTFRQVDNGRMGDLSDGPELDLLDTPWENATTGDLLARAIQDVDMAGNHYVVREDRPGKKPRLRRLRPDWVTIVLTKDPSVATDADIDGYLYRPGNTEDKSQWTYYPVEGTNGQIAHWAPIPDPEALFRGMSWLTPVIREIKGDKAISDHKLKFFENAATPSITVSLKETVNPEEFEEFMEKMSSTKTGLSNAYEPLFLGGGADVQVVGANIQQMDFKTVTAIGETRIAAAARVPASVVGVSEGLQGSSLSEGNFNAAKDQFASGTLRPLWRSICAAYAPLISVPSGKRLWFDDRDISFLREDQEKVSRRKQVDATTLSRLVMQGWKPDDIILALINDDWSLLLGKHSGLYSVQLLPPNISHPEEWGDADQDGNNDTQQKQAEKEAKAAEKEGGEKPSSKKPAGHSKGNNSGSGSKRQPKPGRPSTESKSNDEWHDALTRGEDWEDEDDVQSTE